MGGDIVKKSQAMLEPFLFHRGGGKWRAESEGLFFFQGFQHTFRILHNLFFSPLLCLSIA